MTFDTQDVATILAALRFYQASGMGDPAMRSDAIHDIATDGGKVTSMDAAGIDDLCDRINTHDPLRGAAHNLLAALKRAESHIAWVCDETSEQDLPNWFADLKIIRAAIAKAEGRANG